MTPPPAKLPLWRLVAALLVLGAMVSVLVALAPVYVGNYRLERFTRALLSQPDAAAKPDEIIRGAVLARARELDLPVEPAEVQVTRPNGKLAVQMKYAVEMDFPLYQVDLHFHPSASGK